MNIIKISLNKNEEEYNQSLEKYSLLQKEYEEMKYSLYLL